jgi:hypothetical protein
MIWLRKKSSMNMRLLKDQNKNYKRKSSRSFSKLNYLRKKRVRAIILNNNNFLEECLIELD